MSSYIWKKFKNTMLGCLEIALFMRQGIERFDDGWGPMWRSFLLPVIMMPLTFVTLYHMQIDTPGFQEKSYGFVAMLFVIKWIISLILSLTVLLLFAKAMDRTSHIIKTITVTNWTGVVINLLFLPILFTLMTGLHDWNEVYPVSLILTIYSYVITAFVLTFTLKIPWELAGFLTIIGLAINDTTQDVALWVAQNL